MTVELPLFPLSTVLFPGGTLELRIFEPRYLAMVSRCLTQQTPFGVVAIKHGSEVGAAETFMVGTLATIVDFRQQADGLLGLTVAGGGTFSIEVMRRARDGLYVGDVRMRDAPGSVPLAARHAALADLLHELLARGGRPPPADAAFGDAQWVSCRFAELLPLPIERRQDLLETADAGERLTAIEALLQRPRG